MWKAHGSEDIINVFSLRREVYPFLKAELSPSCAANNTQLLLECSADLCSRSGAGSLTAFPWGKIMHG